MVVDWRTPSRVEVLRQSVTGEVCLRLMGRGPNYTASAYSESGALPVSPLYGMQGIAELDPSKYTSVVKAISSRQYICALLAAIEPV